jgi:hypothetical protein
METDKRPLYLWYSVIIVNLGMLPFLVTDFILSGSITLAEYLKRPDLQLQDLYFIITTLFVTVVPVLISKSRSEFKKYFGYGIPIATLLPLAYLVYDFYTCTGKFCDLADLILGTFISVSAIVFAFFYTIGIYAPKLRPRFIVTIVWIELIVLIGAALYVFFSTN